MDTSEVRENHRFDAQKLLDFLIKSLSLPPSDEPFVIKQFTNGQSNPTFYLRFNEQNEFVMRKKPPGKILRGAHQVIVVHYRFIGLIRNIYILCIANL